MDSFLMGKKAMYEALVSMVDQGADEDYVMQQASGVLFDEDHLSKVASENDDAFALGVAAACSELMSKRAAYYATGVASQDPQERADEIVELAVESFVKEADGSKDTVTPTLKGRALAIPGNVRDHLSNNAGSYAAGLGGLAGGGALGLGAGAAGMTGLIGSAALARHLYNKRKAKKQGR